MGLYIGERLLSQSTSGRTLGFSSRTVARMARRVNFRVRSSLACTCALNRMRISFFIDRGGSPPRVQSETGGPVSIPETVSLVTSITPGEWKPGRERPDLRIILGGGADQRPYSICLHYRLFGKALATQDFGLIHPSSNPCTVIYDLAIGARSAHCIRYMRSGSLRLTARARIGPSRLSVGNTLTFRLRFFQDETGQTHSPADTAGKGGGDRRRRLSIRRAKRAVSDSERYSEHDGGTGRLLNVVESATDPYGISAGGKFETDTAWIYHGAT